jgi:hypothetical protein
MKTLLQSLFGFKKQVLNGRLNAPMDQPCKQRGLLSRSLLSLTRTPGTKCPRGAMRLLSTAVLLTVSTAAFSEPSNQALNNGAPLATVWGCLSCAVDF